MNPFDQHWQVRRAMLVGWVSLAMLAGCGGQSPSAATAPVQPSQPTDELKPAAGRAEEEGIIEPEADALLRRMSAYLGGLKSFRVDTTTIDELITEDGQKIQFVKNTKVAVRRPDKLLAERTGPVGQISLRYDGKQLSVHSPEMGIYAMATAPAELESMIDYARDRLGIDAPAGDLLLADSYNALIDGVLVGRYMGQVPIGDDHTHHLAMTEKDVDWQLWIKDGPDPVPIRYVITTKDLPGRPQFTAELHDWRADPALSDEQFAFQPPADAKRMEFDELQKIKPKRKSDLAGQQGQ